MSQIIEQDSRIIQKAERKVDSWMEKNELEKQGEDDKDMEEEIV